MEIEGTVMSERGTLVYFGHVLRLDDLLLKVQVAFLLAIGK